MSGATDRRCGTCRHFEPSGSWRRGWCRNTLLFAPGQSYQVQSEELDCSRGSGDFWEPPRDSSGESLDDAGKPNVKLPKFSSPLKLFSPAPPRPAFGLAGIGGNMMFASGGGGGGDYDPDDYDEYDDEPVEPERRPRASRSSRASGHARDTVVGRPRTAQYQPEERYWTDYLRIALPVIGLLLMIGLLWFWADRLINDDPDVTEPTSREEIGLVTTAAATDPPAQIVSTPPPADTTAPGGVTEMTPAAGADTSGETGDTQAADETDPPEPPADTGGNTYTDGDTVTTTESINLRPDPSTSGDPIAVLEAGDTLTINGGPEEGETYVWWEVVTEDGTTGWVVEDFIQPAQ